MLVNSVFAETRNVLATTRKEVHIPNFGTLAVKTRASRNLFNISTQRIQPTKARDYIEFRQHYKFLPEAEGDAEVQAVKASEK